MKLTDEQLLEAHRGHTLAGGLARAALGRKVAASLTQNGSSDALEAQARIKGEER